MLIVTDSARELLRSILVANTDDSLVCLRLVLRSTTQLELLLDEPAEGDQVVEHEGHKVMVVDHQIASSLDGGTLDVETAGDGERLFLAMG